MLSPMQMLRMRNIFPGGESQESPTYPTQFGGGMPAMQPPTEEEIPFNAAARMQELYHPETAASDRFNQLQTEYPQYEQPGKLRKIGGAILGSLTDLGTNLGGNRAGVKGTDVFNETTGRNKRDRDIASWKEKMGPAQQSAQLERQNNMNERQMATSTVNAELTGRKNEQIAKNQESANRTREDRAAVYRYKAEHPDHKFMQGKDGILRALDPATNTVISLGKTGMSDAEMAELNQKNAIKKIEATGDEARETERTREKGRETIAETRGWVVATIPGPDGNPMGVRYNQITGETKPIEFQGKPTVVTPTPKNGAGSKEESATQKHQHEYNNARQIAQSDTKLGKWIHLSKSGEFQVQKPDPDAWTASGRGPTEAEYNQINAMIFGGARPNTPNTGGRGSGPGAGKPQGIRVRNAQGKTGIFTGTAEQAKAQGLTPIIQ